VLAAERELAVAFGVGDEAQHVFDGETLAALALASAAHAAVERADVLELGGQPFLVVAAEGRGHGLEVFFELIDVRHAGTVVWTLRLRVTHLSADSMPPSCFSF